MTTVTLTVGTQWTVPANVRSIYVTMIGGGGGGAGGIRIYDMGEWTYGGYGGLAAVPVGGWVYTVPGSVIIYSIGQGGYGGQGGYATYPQTNCSYVGGTTTFTGMPPAVGGRRQCSFYTGSANGGAGEDSVIPGINASNGYGSTGYIGGTGGSGYGSGGGGGAGHCGDFGCGGGAGAQGCIIIEYGQTPVASFNYSIGSGGKAPCLVTFTDTSTGGAVAWDWDFGDGSAHSTLQNPTHTYTYGAVFTACLRATGGTGSVSGAYCRSFTIGTDPPTANFSATPLSGTPPLTVQFTDLSTLTSGWSWDFGDGGSSVIRNPTHTYTTTGSKTVALIATNISGSDTETKVAYISLTAKPIAAFVVRPKEVLQLAPFSDSTGTKIKLYDKSTFYGSSPSSWSWSVTSTGKTTQTSTKQNPEITLPVEAGLTPVYWTVTLTVTDALGVTSDPAVSTYAIVQRTVKP